MNQRSETSPRTTSAKRWLRHRTCERKRVDHRCEHGKLKDPRGALSSRSDLRERRVPSDWRQPYPAAFVESEHPGDEPSRVGVVERTGSPVSCLLLPFLEANLEVGDTPFHFLVPMRHSRRHEDHIAFGDAPRLPAFVDRPLAVFRGS